MFFFPLNGENSISVVGPRGLIIYIISIYLYLYTLSPPPSACLWIAYNNMSRSLLFGYYTQKKSHFWENKKNY